MLTKHLPLNEAGKDLIKEISSRGMWDEDFEEIDFSFHCALRKYVLLTGGGCTKDVGVFFRQKFQDDIYLSGKRLPGFLYRNH